MPDRSKLNDILDVFEKLQAEQPKSAQGVKAAARRARKILVTLKSLCPEVRREPLDEVVYPVDSAPNDVTTTSEQESNDDVDPQQTEPLQEPPLTREQIGRGMDLRNLDL